LNPASTTSFAILTRRDTRNSRRAPAAAPAADAPVPTPIADASMFFVVSGLALAVVAVILLRGAGPAAIGVIVFSLLAAGIVGLAAVGVLGPLVGLTREHGPTIGGRARIALERDKALTLRAIKELEFDRAMGKVSDADFIELRDRLRQRALRLMRQLEGGGAYRQLIEQEVAARVGETAERPALPSAPGRCTQCDTANDVDARFCKACGHRIGVAARGRA
jgi:hypothetical protein